MPPRPAKKPMGGPAGPKRPVGRPDRMPPRAQVAGEVAKAVEAPAPVKEQNRGMVVQDRAGQGRDSSANVSGAGDTSRPFTLQFGTINPGLMNGMQIPARTSSAPPNLDEQKMDQSRRESFRAVPTMSVPSIPKVQPQQPRKDVGSADRSTIETPQPPSQVKRDVHAPMPSGPVGAPPKATNILPPMPTMAGNIPFQHQQPQVALQFGGPNPQMHPQGLAANSLPIPMALPVGSAPQGTQPLFLSSHHMLPQPQMMHQGPGMGFVTPPHQLAPPLGTLGMGLVTQFPQQQPNKFGGSRKTTVKITHPETHEELRLDKRTDASKDATSSVQRSLSSTTVQSPLVGAAYPPPTQYYAAVQPNAYNTSQLFSAHVPLSSSQMPTGSQGPRYPHPVGQSGQFPQVPSNVSVGKAGPQALRGAEVVNLGGPGVSAPASSSVQVTVKHPPTSQVEKGRSSVTISMPISKVEPSKVAADVTFSHQRNTEPVAEPVKKAALPSLSKSTSDTPFVPSTHKAFPEASSSGPSSPLGGSVPVLQGNEGNRREIARRSDSSKDNQKKSIKKDHKNSLQPQEVHFQSKDDYFVDSAKGSSAKTIKESKVGDDNLQVPLINCESEQPQMASTLATSASPSSQVHCNTSQDTGSSRPRVSTNELSSRTGGASLQQTEKSGALVSSGPLSDGTGPNELDIGVNSAEGVVDAARNEDAKLSKELLQDLANSKPHPVSLDKSSENASRLTLVETNDELVRLSDKAETDKNVLDKQLGSAGQGVTSADEKDSKEKVHISDKPMELIAAESASVSCASYASSGKNESLFENLKTGHELSLQEDKVALVSETIYPNCTPELSLPQGNLKVEDNVVPSGGAVSLTTPGSKENHALEILKPKVIPGKKKKKMKEMLSKADAAGASDLYNAYKGPEEKPEVVASSDSAKCSLPDGESEEAVDVLTNGTSASQHDGQNKSELDDWEDAVDISTPRLRATEQAINTNHLQHDGDEDEVTGRKKYSRDFLITLSHQFIGLPQGFQIGPDIANSLMSVPVAKQHAIDLDPYSSSGMIIDRTGAPRDRRTVSNMGDDKWTRLPGPFGTGQDPRFDVGQGVSLRPGQGANPAALRNPRGHSSSQFTGGILLGSQMVLPQGNMARYSSDADRWQKATGGQRGLIPSPQGPMQIMHKAEKRYEIGKVSDEEQAKQRQLKGILNKLTPQNFDKLFAQVIEVNIDNLVTLAGVISQIFDKALMEPTFCEMYADFCLRLSIEMPDFVEGTEKINFRRLLLNKCQEEFERGEREQAEANRVEEEGEIKQSEEEKEEKRIRARRRMLGNIRLIGELYKKKMLTERIMHECIKKLLGQGENPDEEDIEALCKLMSTIGEIIDHSKAKEHLDAYFEQMMSLSTNQKLSPRVRFLLRDTIDLRKNRWRQRIKVEGPKKIDEVHRDAAQERQGQGSRSMRGPVISSIPRRGPTIDYGLRGSSPLMAPVSQQVAGIRGMPPQIRSYTQDARVGDRHQFESRSLPLSQRSAAGDDSITLGPQGGLARGMSIRGQPLMSNAPPAENLGVGDYRRVPFGQNGHSPLILESSSFNLRESRMPERTFDRSASIPPSGRSHASSVGSHIPTFEVKMSEDQLREKSLLAIKEFYSIRDEKELVMCVRDLEAPTYYPTMLFHWITDSFGKKLNERDLLAKLIVSLCKSHDGLIRPGQLLQGFEHVLSSLEDALLDAPSAVGDLGRIFATTIMENVIPLKEVGRLIHEGGQEPGQLLEAGLAANILASILESIKSEKGDSVLNNIRVSSNLQLVDFLPPDHAKTRLDAFL